MNVLVSSAGTASAISVIKALRLQNEHPVRITAVDSDPTAPGLYLADEYAIVPKCSQPDYVPRILSLCEEHQIRAFYPIYSAEIEVVAANARLFAERGVGLLLTPAATVRNCNDKSQMYRLANSLGIPTPADVDMSAANLSFPLFAKPNSASGSIGARRIEDAADLAYMKARHPDFLFQHYVEGPEYTVDVLCDQGADLIVGSPRLRLAIKAGQSVKGRTVEEPALVTLCAALCKAVGIVGPCNLQFIQQRGKFIFIELNPRYPAGGLMLTVKAGANLPLLALKLMLGERVDKPAIRPGVTMLRYWEEVFLN